ncbi:hypothetical protein M2360_001039 [Rhizobium sp. SG_E_25_P2]|uniref:hypothetical protein n=1 Tax=Rhizobium sp. SG_E_25_P2 TaxID=2879942 RepID=UPI0024764777|nr:hypothetical protein [Rhizobium sp. SG_E_25_P2]MDH6265649.1 hypothetical protein [Rhizobium sp. SG_E_25_P2]
MTIVSDSPVTLSARDETTFEIAAIIDEMRLSAEPFGTYDVAKRVMEISHAHFLAQLQGALEKELAPIREMTSKLADHFKAIRQQNINLPPDVVSGIRREFGDNRH